MKTKKLLSQLRNLEQTLNDFSFEELTAIEASRLKKSFQAFKINLEHKILTPSSVFGGVAEANLEEQPESTKIKLDTSVNADELVARVSHEIRTPLNGIIGFTDLLKDDELTNKQLERVNAIQTASYSLMGIINELLEFSKLSAGLVQNESVNFNLSSVVDNVMYLCDTLVTEKNIELKITIDKTIPDVLLGDPSKLSQILMNLVGNAIRFVESGTVHLSVNIKKQKGEDFQLVFFVADTGIGIASDQLETIFDSYKQAKSSIGTTGLGLTIVKQIIETLNGSISVSSELGVGTTFQFTLGYKKGSISRTSDKSTEQKNYLDLKESVRDMKILVFEDNAINQKLISHRLKSWHCKTYVTDNALYGLNLLESNNIDLVLMDLKMPNMNGFEVTQLIRRSESKAVRNIPIIAVSADFSYRDRDQFKKHKINDFILKPYSPEELLHKLVENKNRMKTLHSFESKSINPEIEVYSDATKINLSIILEDCLGRIDFLEELVLLYKQNALEFMGVVKVHLENDDLSEIEFAAHKLKSGLAMLQSKSLYNIVDRIQHICNGDGDKKHLQFLHGCFVEEYPLVEAAIDEQVTALKRK